MMVAVRVYVTDETGMPIGGAIVRRREDAGADSTVTTDPAGFATIAVASGFDMITVVDEGAPAEAELTFGFSEDSVGPHERTVMLLRGAPLGGTVVDPSGVPIEGAIVQVWTERDRHLFRETDTNGVWLVRAMSAGAYEVRAGAEGYARGPTISGVHDGRTATLDLTLSVAAGAALVGRVVDANNQPCVGTSVFTQVMPGDDGHAITDADGRYEIRGLESGRRSVDAVGSNLTIVIPDGVARYELDITTPPTKEEETGATVPRCHRPARPELERAATVAGRVVRDGKPVEHFAIELRGEGVTSGLTTIHARDGRFSLAQPREWTCTVSVFALGSTWTRTPAFALLPATTHELGDIELAPGARITGVVRDVDGNAVAAATVSFGISSDRDDQLVASARGFYRATSRADGTFTFESVYVAERSEIVASHANVGTSRSLPIDGAVELALVLLPTGAIDGVLEQPGRSSALLIHGQTPGSGSHVCDVRPSGSFAIERLVPGDYTLEVIRRPRWPKREVRVTVEAGNRRFVRFPPE